VTITLSKVDFEKVAPESFYQPEKQARQIVSDVAKEPTREILQSSDIDNSERTDRRGATTLAQFHPVEGASVQSYARPASIFPEFTNTSPDFRTNRFSPIVRRKLSTAATNRARIS